MKHIFIISMFVLLASVGCTDTNEELLAGGEVNLFRPLPANKPNEVVDPRLFDVINLDYPGLERVKAHYEANEYYYAAYELLQYYRNRGEVINPNVNLITPSITETEQNIADQALEYRFYIKGFQESMNDGKATYYSFKKDGKINWKYVPDGITDQEFTNQFHRQQWMFPQAKAYRISRDEKYITSWIEVYGDWLRTFPCPEGKVDKNKNVEWYGLQPAHRVQDQLDMIPYFIQSDHFTPEWLSTFLIALADEVECIRKNYYSETNILLTQIESVVTAGILMPEFEKAGEWLEEGAAKSMEQVDAQFAEDGVHVELTFGYHVEAVYALYKIYKMAQLNNKLDVFSSNYTEQLKKAARFVMDSVYPDYTVDNFNDTGSSAWTKSVLLGNFRRYAEMFPDDEGFKWMATEGIQGKAPKELIQMYTTSGYYMLRSKWSKDALMMILKNNYNPKNYWHCQGDNGTFGLYRNGRNFCPDAGFYSYGNEDPNSQASKDRVAYAATTMHNTMTKNKATIASGYMKGKFLKQDSKNGIDVLVTENQSYSDLAHRRAVFFVNKTFFVLVDEGYGTASNAPVNLTFNIAPAGNVTIDDDKENYKYGAYTNFTDDNNMLFKTFTETTTGYSVETDTNSFSNELGVVSGKRKWYRVNITKESDKAARFITVIYPFKNETERTNLNIDAKFTDNNEAGTAGTFHAKGASVEVTVGGKKYELSYTI